MARHRHLLRVATRPAADFAPLFAAAAEAGMRLGWLELGSPAPLPSPLPAELEAAADAGALRAVAVAGGRAVAVKPMRGAPVLHDLLREYFRGCALVLVAGEETGVEAPRLAPGGEGEGDGDGWVVVTDAGDRQRFTAPDLIARLRRPRPW